MDTILRNARVADGPDAPVVDIGIENGRIATIEAPVDLGCHSYAQGTRR